MSIDGIYMLPLECGICCRLGIICTHNQFVLTLAYSTRRVQQPEYMSHPLSALRARLAASNDSNSTMAWIPFFLKITIRNTFPLGLHIVWITSCKEGDTNNKLLNC